MKKWAVLLVGVAAIILIVLLRNDSAGRVSMPVATLTPIATPRPYEVGGIGDSVIEIPYLGHYSKAHIVSSTPGDNFIVIAYDSNNDYLDLLVNEIGRYDGTVRWDPMTASLEIKAGGKWTITLLH